MINPFTRNNGIKWYPEENEEVHCVVCDNKELTLEEYSPDVGLLLFCSQNCHDKLYKPDGGLYLYRSSGLRPYIADRAEATKRSVQEIRDICESKV